MIFGISATLRYEEKGGVVPVLFDSNALISVGIVCSVGEWNLTTFNASNIFFEDLKLPFNLLHRFSHLVGNILPPIWELKGNGSGTEEEGKGRFLVEASNGMRNTINEFLVQPLPKLRPVVFCLTEFGGVGDNITLNTKTFEKGVRTISKLRNKGGGQLTLRFFLLLHELSSSSTAQTGRCVRDAAGAKGTVAVLVLAAEAQGRKGSSSGTRRNTISGFLVLGGVPVQPSSKLRPVVFCLTKFGGVVDDVTLNTEAFEKGVRAISKLGNKVKELEGGKENWFRRHRLMWEWCGREHSVGDVVLIWLKQFGVEWDWFVRSKWRAMGDIVVWDGS
ncbi:uncharacterized protein HKW66_Vig0035560 [Vigna angularis]|uniref:Uncharacterized protein n=1 Tax=Phaseolus angularis TaxID=3914 RepID=A0A8T0L9T4_PHAAN|nr:uncharacterized protein HKW66_Vig0035560 [Vigna angularis]